MHLLHIFKLIFLVNLPTQFGLQPLLCILRQLLDHVLQILYGLFVNLLIVIALHVLGHFCNFEFFLVDLSGENADVLINYVVFVDHFSYFLFEGVEFLEA